MAPTSLILGIVVVCCPTATAFAPQALQLRRPPPGEVLCAGPRPRLRSAPPRTLAMGVEVQTIRPGDGKTFPKAVDARPFTTHSRRNCTPRMLAGYRPRDFEDGSIM
jgi:hypothetical protein